MINLSTDPPPSITSLGVLDSSNSSELMLNCTSTGSPATSVTWSKDGVVLSDSVEYKILRDGSTATYNNLLSTEAGIDELLGTYACSVLNSGGQSNVESLNIQGMLIRSNQKCSTLLIPYIVSLGISITGNQSSFAVGTDVQLGCSSDLTVLMTEWLHHDVVIVQNTSGEAVLEIPAVNDSLHNMEYKCRVTTPFGVLERSTIIIVTGIQLATYVSQ